MIKIVHCKKSVYDVYIGRPSDPKITIEHFGNPFTHKSGTKALIVLPTREDAIQAHLDWISGIKWLDIEPDRRKWILDNLHLLKDKVIACWCAPLSCHGDNYKRLIEM